MSRDRNLTPLGRGGEAVAAVSRVANRPAGTLCLVEGFFPREHQQQPVRLLDQLRGRRFVGVVIGEWCVQIDATNVQDLGRIRVCTGHITEKISRAPDNAAR